VPDTPREPVPAGPGLIGARARRREDDRFLRGRARYLADHDTPGLLHVAIVRSPVAHARVRGLDLAPARRAPGVVAVLTQADLDAAGVARMSHRLALPGIQPLAWGLLADGTVRFVGDPVAVVVATSPAAAADGAERVEVEYDPLPVVVDPHAALAPDAPLLYPEWGTNRFFHFVAGAPDLDAVLAAAPRRLSRRFTNHRVAAAPLEGHGAQARIDPVTRRLEVLASNQQPHQLRTVIAETIGRRESEVRVIAPDMGGGFGNKQHFTREECLVAALATMLDRPVRWSQTRHEALTASVHSREQVHDVRVGFDATGRVLAYHVDVVANVGNPLLYFSGIGPALVTVGSLSGAYDLGAVGFDLQCVATNTCPIGAYRGFGQPQAHFSSERTLDLIARELALDPADVRRRNLLPDAPRPFIAPGGARIDVGALEPQLDELLVAFDYAGWRDRQIAARAAGRCVGIGLSTLVQGTAPTQHGVAGRFGSYETATVSVLPDGEVTVAVGTMAQGQAHETVFAQIAADALGAPLDAVHVSEGDTDVLPYGMGSWGSRSAVMGGGAVLVAATRLREKVDKIAAELGVRTLAEVAEVAWWHPHRLPENVGAGLTTTVVYSPGNTRPEPDEHGHVNFDETFASHASAIAVEVDVETGAVAVLDAVIVSDCGVVINPAVVEGQHQGGFAQALGAVLYEHAAYDDDGQPRATSFIDYLLPGAPEVPSLRVVHRETPSATAGGFRGMAEATITAMPAAIAGAVDDALAPLGVEVTTTRLGAADVWGMVTDAAGSPVSR